MSENDMISYVRTSVPHTLNSHAPRHDTPHATHPGLQSVFMNVKLPHAASVKYAVLLLSLASLLQKWEVSHDRDYSTSPGSLTFRTACFVILLMHIQCLLLAPFWHMLNVEWYRKHVAAAVQCLNVINYLKVICFNLPKLMSVLITTCPFCCSQRQICCCLMQFDKLINQMLIIMRCDIIHQT